MTLPSSSIYVRPGANSLIWSYAGTGVSAVAFDLDSGQGQQVGRGDFLYSADGGRNWAVYTLGVDREGMYLPASTLWRFADHAAADTVTPGSFTMRLKLDDGSSVAVSGAVVVDTPPAGLADDRDTMFASLHAGDTVATLAPIDTGAPDGGRWVIDGQSQAGLFAIVADPGGAAAARIVIAPGAVLPPAGQTPSVTVHYYDRYQVDTNGVPIPGHGVVQTFSYTVVEGVAQGGPAFGPELALGASSASAGPALAALPGGGFVAVWQGSEQGGGGIWAQLRDGSGAAGSAQFGVAAAGGVAEGEPALAALAGQRFAIAYTVGEPGATRVAYRVFDGPGNGGAQLLADAGAAPASMPSMAALADGSFALAWRSGGAVHVRQIAADGAPLGAERVFAALGSAFSPSVTALANGDYALAWGELNDGNVYAALGSQPGAAILVGGDNAAASLATGAPLPHLAALEGGGFVVAWDSYRNEARGYTMSDIFFQRFGSDGQKAGELVQANADSGGTRFDGALAALSGGGFVVAWQADHGDFDGNGIFGRRFGADGAALDAREFAINQDRAGDQATPALTALPGGGFVAAWVDTASGASHIELRVLPGTAGSGVSIGGAALSVAGVQPTALTGSSAGDVFDLGGGSQLVDGHDGLDVALYHGARAGFSVARSGDGFVVDEHATGGGHDTLLDMERIRFSDMSVALDIDGAAGQAFRLYQAAFDRAPDAGGLGYWISMIDRGESLQNVAASFTASGEFASLYGANASDAQFVSLLYQNVLHRAAEGEGFDYWMAALGTHHLPREVMLGYFSESAENKAQVIGSIEHGIDFLPWI